MVSLPFHWHNRGCDTYLKARKISHSCNSCKHYWTVSWWDFSYYATLCTVTDKKSCHIEYLSWHRNVFFFCLKMPQDTTCTKGFSGFLWSSQWSLKQIALFFYSTKGQRGQEKKGSCHLPISVTLFSWVIAWL